MNAYPLAEFWRDTPSALPAALMQIRNEIFALFPSNNDGTTVDLEITKKYIQNNYDVVRTHLLNNGYIDEPDHTRKWKLNEQGRLMKELGGHEKYRKHRKRQLNILINQYWINLALIIATILAAVMPFVAQQCTHHK